jgi:RNase P subunit RPR2
MEIIRHGQLPLDKTYTVTCRNCDTVYRFQRSEARFHSDQRDGDALATDCPVCQRTIFIAVSNHDRA